MRTILKTMPLIIIATLLMSGCGDDNDANFITTEQKITLTDIPCKTTTDLNVDDLDSYITLLSGDEIIEEESDSEVIIYHNIDGTRSICLASGSAYILRIPTN